MLILPSEGPGRASECSGWSLHTDLRSCGCCKSRPEPIHVNRHGYMCSVLSPRPTVPTVSTQTETWTRIPLVLALIHTSLPPASWLRCGEPQPPHSTHTVPCLIPQGIPGSVALMAPLLRHTQSPVWELNRGVHCQPVL